MNKAVFLDRDGVINHDPDDYTKSLSEFTINPGVMDALKSLYDAGFLLILITNQGGISKGKYEKEAVEEIHSFFVTEAKKNGIQIAEIYYCPHHSDIEACICRKPDSQLVEKGLARFNIDPLQSYFIGDKQRDVECGEKAGVKGIKIELNTDLMPYIQEFILHK